MAQPLWKIGVTKHRTGHTGRTVRTGAVIIVFTEERIDLCMCIIG